MYYAYYLTLNLKIYLFLEWLESNQEAARPGRWPPLPLRVVAVRL